MQLPDLPQTELAIIEMTNSFRAEQKLGTLKSNAALTAAARAFAQYLAATGKFGHTADGRNPADRTSAAGYRHCLVAENLAMNQDSRGFATRGLAEHAMTGWKNSPPHRAAMLNPHVTEIGVGVVKSADAAPKYLSVQLFGRPDTYRFTFRIENRSGGAISYTYNGKVVDVPNSTSMTQTVCTPGQLSFPQPKLNFFPSDGAVYRAIQGTGGAWSVEAMEKPVSPAGAQPGKSR